MERFMDYDPTIDEFHNVDNSVDMRSLAESSRGELSVIPLSCLPYRKGRRMRLRSHHQITSYRRSLAIGFTYMLGSDLAPQ